MDSEAFDRLTRLLSATGTRRSALGALLSAAVLSTGGIEAARRHRKQRKTRVATAALSGRRMHQRQRLPKRQLRVPHQRLRLPGPGPEMLPAQGLLCQRAVPVRALLPHHLLPGQRDLSAWPRVPPGRLIGAIGSSWRPRYAKGGMSRCIVFRGS